MSTPSYTNNYRRNLELYWRQFCPQWTIPVGFHVHHIKPKVTFENKDDPRIHHPRNLIALHPDDHLLIHKLRGDKFVNNSMILSITGQVSHKKGKPGKTPWNKGLTKNSDHPGMRNLRRALKGRLVHNKGKSSPLKGKTYAEIHGSEKAAELIELRKKAKLRYWNEK